MDDKISKEDQRIIDDSLKEKLKNFGDTKFMSRRKIEYLELKKRPCYS
jgi:hypothetical protein